MYKRHGQSQQHAAIADLLPALGHCLLQIGRHGPLRLEAAEMCIRDSLINTVYYPDATGSEPYITTFSYDLKDAVYNKDENGAYLSSGFMGGREYNILSLIHI